MFEGFWGSKDSKVATMESPEQLHAGFNVQLEERFPGLVEFPKVGNPIGTTFYIDNDPELITQVGKFLAGDIHLEPEDSSNTSAADFPNAGKFFGFEVDGGNQYAFRLQFPEDYAA